MAVRIRMKRLGRTHRPFYRVCVMHQQNARDGKAIEEVGWYDPMIKDKTKRIHLNLERIEYWTSVGAQPSDRVATLIKKVKTNRFTSPAAPAPMQAPKIKPKAEAPAAAEGGEPPAEG